MFRLAPAITMTLLSLLTCACAPGSHTSTGNGQMTMADPGTVPSFHTGSPNSSAPAPVPRNNASPVLADGEGGVNGGGGTTLPAQPIDTLTVHTIIDKTVKELLPIIKNQLWGFDKKTAEPMELKLYGGHPNLVEMLADTDVEILDKAPCKDALGRDVDGSVHASKPNAICISAFRIAPKLVEETAPKEIYALIIHELSHKLGATEKEAREIQRRYSLDFSFPFSSHETADDFLKNLRGPMENLSAAIPRDLDKMTEDIFAKKLDNLSLADLRFFEASLRSPRSLYDREESDLFQVAMERVRVINFFFLAKQNSYWKDELDQAFKNKQVITYQEWDNRHGGPTTDNIFGATELKRINSLEEAKVEIKAALEVYDQVYSQFSALEFGQIPNRLRLPNAPASPFKNFVGTYEVVGSTCTDPRYHGDTTELEIRNYAGDQALGPHLIEKGLNWSSDQGGLYDGGNVHVGSSRVTVSGSATSATRSQESGSRWDSEQISGYTKQSEQIESTPSGYTFTQHYYSTSSQMAGSKVREGSCVYNLKKTD